MKPSDYRKQIEREIKDATKAAKKHAKVFRSKRKKPEERLAALQSLGQLEDESDLRLAYDVAGGGAGPAELRAAALGQLGPLMARDARILGFVIERLADRDEVEEVRSAAATLLKAAPFHTEGLGEHRGAYMAAFRKAADADDRVLRDRVLGVLAREGDSATLKRLEEGIRNPAKALVPPEKALQLLSYDSKRANKKLIDGVLKNPPSEAARLQALRNLVADGSSKKMFEKLLRNKKETRDARLIAVSALQSLDPGKLHAAVGEVAADGREDEELRAACFTAAATLDTSAPTETLRKAATKFQDKATSGSAKQAAKQYLTRCGEGD